MGTRLSSSDSISTEYRLVHSYPVLHPIDQKSLSAKLPCAKNFHSYKAIKEPKLVGVSRLINNVVAGPISIENLMLQRVFFLLSVRSLVSNSACTSKEFNPKARAFDLRK